MDPGAISPLPSVPGTSQANSLLVYAVISGLICAQCAILGLKGERLHVYPLHTDAHGHPVLSPSPTPHSQDAIPFAVVGSNSVIDVNNKKVRGRMYPWGVAEVENIEHCDFTTLRNMLIR